MLDSINRQMKSIYTFGKAGCIKKYVTKKQLCEIHQEDVSTLPPANLTQMDIEIAKAMVTNRFPLSGPINGRIYRNRYTTYCCCFAFSYPYHTYEVQGYKTKLTQVKPKTGFAYFDLFCPYSSFCLCRLNYYCCPPLYSVEDNDDVKIGQFLSSCCTLSPCCTYLNISTLQTQDAFVIRPVCTLCFACDKKWTIMDRSGELIGAISLNLCNMICCDSKVEINFFNSLPNEQKLLIMSAIPILP